MNKFNFNEKINYYQKSLETLEQLQQDSAKPRLLLHACCAPCSAFPLQWLSQHFDCTLYYANSNIYPRSEYNLRLEELKEYIQTFNKKNQATVSLLVPSYDNQSFTEKLQPLKEVPEGGQRCFLCYALRLEDTFSYAKQHQFDYVTTVMTISRHKNSQILNQLGKRLATEYSPVQYFYSDFKKNGGQQLASQLSKENQLYRQQYCGCQFSYEEFLKKKM